MTEVAKVIDLRGVPCPLSFVRTKLSLEKLQSGQRLEVWLDRGEPIEQVPNSLVMDGHTVELIAERAEEGRTTFFAVTVQKA
jgi:TusA-related sulfurtransferase